MTEDVRREVVSLNLPDRVWFAVPRDGVSPPRELAWEDVAALEPGPWR